MTVWSERWHICSNHIFCSRLISGLLNWNRRVTHHAVCKCVDKQHILKRGNSWEGNSNMTASEGTKDMTWGSYCNAIPPITDCEWCQDKQRHFLFLFAHILYITLKVSDLYLSSLCSCCRQSWPTLRHCPHTVAVHPMPCMTWHGMRWTRPLGMRICWSGSLRLVLLFSKWLKAIKLSLNIVKRLFFLRFGNVSFGGVDVRCAYLTMWIKLIHLQINFIIIFHSCLCLCLVLLLARKLN